MAPAPTKRRVSYIIPPPSEPVVRLELPAADIDRLGRVRPLLIPSPRQEYDQPSRTPEGILYTAGRDGLVLSWDLGLPLQRRLATDNTRRRGRWEALTGWADDAIDEETEEPEPTSDGDILGDVPTSSRRRLTSGVREVPFEEQWELNAEVTPPASSFRQCVQPHTDWVNDILLCNYNQTLVSASSDGTVQAWSPHAAGTPDPSTVGTHSDYVRCLASCRTQNWIATGSFDRTIKLWDLSRSQSTPDALTTLQPADANSPKCSVYALAADPFGHAIASGGPERVVRMWDPRTGKRSGKLVGHTDNIRAILLSEDAKYVSTSIKLWSLATQRCLHTFTHHADSVWSLFSSHPLLETFYAGDRAGIVSRVDVSRLSDDVGEGECVLVCRDGEDVSLGSSQSQGEGGINKIVVADDSLVWTATNSSSVRRWRIPPRNNASSMPGTSYSASYKDYESTYEREGRSLAPSVLSYDGDDADEGEGDTRHGIPYASLVRLTSPIDPYPIRSGGGGVGRDPEVATLYSAASVISVPALRSPQLHSSTSPHIGSPMRSVPLPNSRGAYFGRELAADAQPLAPLPDAVGTLAGERGLVRALVLNDRVHAVSIDTGGEVGVWDLVRGLCVGVIPHDVATAGGKQSPREALELVRERLEGEAVVAPWATVDTKSGVLAVHLNERSFESEIYADEVGFAGDGRFGDESKINIGKLVLRNLFLGFIREEVRSRRARRDSTHSQDTTSSAHYRVSVSSDTSSRHRGSFSTEPRRRTSNSTVISSSRMVPAVTPAVSWTPMGTSPLLTPLIPLLVRGKDHMPLPPIVGSPSIGSEMNGKDSASGDYFGSRPRQTSIQNGVAPGAAGDDFSGWSGPGAQTPSTPTSLMGRLKSFGKKRVADVATPSLPPTVAPIAEETAPDPAAKTPVQMLLAGPLLPPSSSESPTLGLSPHILLLIEEEAEPAFKTVYRGTVGSTGSSGDVHALETTMPLWLLEYLLLHRMPSTPPQVKLSFVLLPWIDKDNKEDQLPELLNTTQSKLTASRFLRVRKLIVQEKLEKLDPQPADPPRARPEDLYEILCNDLVLPLDMSIAAVRQYVWRQSAELTMHYRRQRPRSTSRT
ncbi:hypothetical protein C8F01DRAFT_1123933 [Mycena amicta]|nr:hypothetical protein C8F01DRAFT_1123933 [Mycena amicta]